MSRIHRQLAAERTTAQTGAAILSPLLSGSAEGKIRPAAFFGFAMAGFAAFADEFIAGRADLFSGARELTFGR